MVWKCLKTVTRAQSFSVDCYADFAVYSYYLHVCYSGKYIPPHQRGTRSSQTSDSFADSDSGSGFRGGGGGGGQGKSMCSILRVLQDLSKLV